MIGGYHQNGLVIRLSNYSKNFSIAGLALEHERLYNLDWHDREEFVSMYRQETQKSTSLLHCTAMVLKLGLMVDITG